MPESQSQDYIYIHYLIPDEAGPVQSGGLRFGPQQLGGGRFRAACDPELHIDGYQHRGSGEVWAVHCEACEATERYRKDYRPHPRHAGRTRATKPREQLQEKMAEAEKVFKEAEETMQKGKSNATGGISIDDDAEAGCCG